MLVRTSLAIHSVAAEGRQRGCDEPRSICQHPYDDSISAQIPLTMCWSQYLLLCPGWWFFETLTISSYYTLLPFELGALALNDLAYSQGIGGYDKVAIDYGYRIFDQDDENPLLIKLIDDAERNGYTFLNDQVSPALSETAILAHSFKNYVWWPPFV